MKNKFLTTEQAVKGYLKLANLVENQGNFEQAERVYKSALAIAEKESGAESILAGYVLNELSDLYEKQGDLEQARALRERLSNLLMPHYSKLLKETQN